MQLHVSKPASIARRVACWSPSASVCVRTP